MASNHLSNNNRKCPGSQVWLPKFDWQAVEIYGKLGPVSSPLRITGDPDEIKYAACPNVEHISRQEPPTARIICHWLWLNLTRASFSTTSLEPDVRLAAKQGRGGETDA